ncbi:nuclear transport factor 2 family protein [Catellatospora tritici]|uniref:nuclear transport factor 2 family protein n=1 Tax=Catellatospora tritici TaxID=2851566 RepID=UPI001C2D8884|nr:nuclear transport factor 2 family protein [Catellatospora tritici]MBV1856362.1 ester cyclase [Catellatospora tritici]
MADDEVSRNLKSMDELDFKAWNTADWHGLFAHLHTDDVLVEVHGQPPTHGIDAHIDAMKALVQAGGGTPAQVTSHPITFGSGEWTCVVGEFAGGGRMVTVAKWRDGAIAEEYIWI